NGPWQGRARLIERLGREANDPLDELLNSAFAYEAVHTPSLVGFIHWFEAGTAEVKRDADSTAGQVRVLTVHGSKGLQAPIVILADAAGAPSEARELSLTELRPGDQTGRAVPLPPLAKSERVGPVSAAQAQAATAEMQEHWRLLYVAMTRAEEALFIGGSLGPRDAKQGKPHDDSWHARLEPIFEQPPLSDPLWGERREWGRRAAPLASAQQHSVIAQLPALPAWATTPIGPEPRPPRPLAPSAAGEEQGADPPLPPGAPQSAARRGILIHRLLERLPDVPPDERLQAATSWLARQAEDLPPAMREEMAVSALGVLDDPAFAELFTGAALAEVPLAATIGGLVVAGTVDRLLVREHQVIVVDYKTTRRPPLSVDDVPSSALRQMAAYAAALEAIYPGREVRAVLLYTHAPQLFELDQKMLAPHKDRLGDQQESYALPVIE
ncbi:MAG: PD-(D/E)XK nuclease family protein, partial [Pseudomonadota bacterium]